MKIQTEACQKCHGNGHLQDGTGRFTRCECLKQTMNRTLLGVFYHPTPPATSQLEKLADENLLIEGPLTAIRPHVARVMMNDLAAQRTNVAFDAYKLIDIFLEKDEEYQTTTPMVSADRVIILLGFGDPPNKMLPHLITQVLSRRDLLRRPTWVILGLPREQIAMRYSSELDTKLQTFRRVSIK